MKGKIAFAFGLATGYVLGTRAGRQRYEQIKRGAIAVWETPQVQRFTDKAQGLAKAQARVAGKFVAKKGKEVLDNVTSQPGDEAFTTTDERESRPKNQSGSKKKSSKNSSSGAQSSSASKKPSTSEKTTGSQKQ